MKRNDKDERSSVDIEWLKDSQELYSDLETDIESHISEIIAEIEKEEPVEEYRHGRLANKLFLEWVQMELEYESILQSRFQWDEYKLYEAPIRLGDVVRTREEYDEFKFARTMYLIGSHGRDRMIKKHRELHHLADSEHISDRVMFGRLMDAEATWFARYAAPEIILIITNEDSTEAETYSASGWIANKISFRGRLKRVFDRVAIDEGGTPYERMLEQIPGEVAHRLASHEAQQENLAFPGNRLERLGGVEEALRQVYELDVEARREKERKGGVPLEERSHQVDFEAIQEVIGINPFDRVGEEEIAELRLEEAKTALSTSLWEVFDLYYLQEKTAQEVADILGKKVSTVNVQLHKIREVLGPLWGVSTEGRIRSRKTA